MRKLLTLAGLTALLAIPLRAEILEQVLVKVNGDIITKTELEQRQVAALRQRLNGNVDPDALKNDQELKKLVAEVTPQVLVNSIDELLLVQRGRELGYHLSDDQFKEIVNNILHINGADHQRLRSLVNPSLTPRAVERYRIG